MGNDRIVVYTAIFGGRDRLHEPVATPDGVDFVCFSDMPLRSKHWEVRVVESGEDPVLSARKYKMLPHRYLGGYEASVWVDGNIAVRGNVSDAAARYLAEAPMAVYDHAYAQHRDREKSSDARRSIYEEAENLLALIARGRQKGNPEAIQKQVERYKREGYEGGRVALTNTLFRKHNEEDVKEAMELWWGELKRESVRDQISFPYVLWKTKLSVHWIEENARENLYFVVEPHR